MGPLCVFVDPGPEYLLFSDVVSEVNVRFAVIYKEIKEKKHHASHFNTKTKTNANANAKVKHKHTIIASRCILTWIWT